MNPALIKSIACAAACILPCFGCGKGSSSAPAPLPLDQIQPVIAHAFENAESNIRNQASNYVADMQNQDFSAAFTNMQQLSANPALTPEQKRILARARMTTSQALQDAASGGDQQAAQLLHAFMSTK